MKGVFKNRGYLAVSIVLALGLALLFFYILGVRFITWISIWHPMCELECVDIIANDSYIDASMNMLVLHLRNSGEGVTYIYKIELDEIVVTTCDFNRSIVLKPGERTTLTLQLNGIGVEHNRKYRLKIYTRAGNLYEAYVTPR